MASPSQQPRLKHLIIGITGRIGSGKTTVGKFLESMHGFQYLRYSAVLSDWLAQDPDDKTHLQKIGWEVMSTGMQLDLNRRLTAQILPDRDVAVDGLRHLLDYETLQSSFLPSFRLVFIDSTPQLRFERLHAKGKYLDFASFQSADFHPVEQQIDSLRAPASKVIHNEDSLENLYAAVDETIYSFGKEGQP